MDISFILNELGEERDQYFNAVSPPIMQSSNFCFKDVAGLRTAMKDEFEGNLYSRGQNPTLNILRKKLAALDGAEDALLFSSGISAISIPILSLLKSGDHIIAVDNIYSWTIKLFQDLLPKFGITTTFIDGTVFENFEAAIQPQTRLIYLESPNTFCYDLQDIKRVTTLARSKNITTLIDNSYCSPLFQQPISLGVDLVAQSATKYIGGHSDVVAGVLTGNKAMLKYIFEHEFMNLGPALSPPAAWLLLRGLRTLPLRLQRSFESTKTVTQWLANHPKVQKVIWPFSPDFEQRELVRKQMQGCGGLFSITLKNSSFDKIETFCNSLKHILLAVSWGGHESLVVPAIASVNEDQYNEHDERHQLIRMYIGLEEPQYLIADLEQALNSI
ncbi:trans-sulfuration enzyme family protein [Mucilaginibacter celer]|uniref:Aminotransferase class V-fold PLP-dependent enzyme n=1 Tax=Mucilaginibacter celer TaxID=2305508 RepID=A0A494VI80_9SPHI|nr:aminotransferase class I/II-fold pyridoxal phosphate-dependent enzyme [Mucilaginibacter celer]AYL94546.1 aminotransferase class V-fold PLP-dependent enzyme [Mucilaginibacter celer]